MLVLLVGTRAIFLQKVILALSFEENYKFTREVSLQNISEKNHMYKVKSGKYMVFLMMGE
jgi:hypothetical protein